MVKKNYCEELSELLGQELTYCSEMEQRSIQLRESLIVDDIDRISSSLEAQEILFSKLASIDDRKTRLIKTINLLHGPIQVPPSIEQIEDILVKNGISSASGISSKYKELLPRILKINRSNSVLVKDSLDKSELIINLINRERKDTVYNKRGNFVRYGTAAPRPSMIDHRG